MVRTDSLGYATRHRLTARAAPAAALSPAAIAMAKGLEIARRHLDQPPPAGMEKRAPIPSGKSKMIPLRTPKAGATDGGFT